MTSEDPKMSQEGSDGKRKHVSFTLPQKIKTFKRVESGESQNVVMAPSDIGLSTTYHVKEQDQLQSFMASSESMMSLFKRQTLKKTKLATRQNAV